MVKAFGAMTAQELILGSLGVELAAGQLELVALEAAIVGAVMLVKHIKKKRLERAEQPSQDDAEEPIAADINEEDEIEIDQPDQPPD